MIAVFTTAGAAEKMLQSEYHTFTHKTATSMSVMRLGDGKYSLPARVAAAVDFVGPTVRFPLVQDTTIDKGRLQDDEFGGGVTPSFLRKLYNVGDATGMAPNNNQSVASFLGQYYSPSDLQTFFKQFST